MQPMREPTRFLKPPSDPAPQAAVGEPNGEAMYLDQGARSQGPASPHEPSAMRDAVSVPAATPPPAAQGVPASNEGSDRGTVQRFRVNRERLRMVE
jgi:hypothetical protein